MPDTKATTHDLAGPVPGLQWRGDRCAIVSPVEYPGNGQPNEYQIGASEPCVHEECNEHECVAAVEGQGLPMSTTSDEPIRAWEVISDTGASLHILTGPDAERRAVTVASLYGGATAVALVHKTKPTVTETRP